MPALNLRDYLPTIEEALGFPVVNTSPQPPRLTPTGTRKEQARQFMRRFLWCAIAELGHATATELAAHTNRKITVIRPRLTELAALRQIHSIGQRRAQGARRGPMERVWVINDTLGGAAHYETAGHPRERMG